MAAAFLDLGFEIDGPGGYRASIWEWLGYGGGALASVSTYRWLTADRPHPPAAEAATADVPLDELAQNWNALEKWLSSEDHPDEDWLGNRRVAGKLAEFLIRDGGSVGLVGKFGSGKTTTLRWIKSRLEVHNRSGRRPLVWVCEVSCWGFEDPAAAVHHVLAQAVAEVGRHADCFSVRHLPEAYRKTFSAGGDWVRNLLDLVLGSADPHDQFRSLSGILKAVEARLVVVVEDLDRTSSVRFDRQEVLALLQRLRDVKCVSFVLASGQTTSRDIDFAKLCTRIEVLRGCDPNWSLAILNAFRGHCLAAYQDVPIGTDSEHLWNPIVYCLTETAARPSLPGAAAHLLDTPRTLKHVLRQTYQAWQTLHGEVNFDHLLALNVLRHAAPGTFDYLLRNRDRLLAELGERSGGGRNEGAALVSLREDWQHAVREVAWEPRAALTIVSFLFPNAARIQSDRDYVDRTRRPQGIGEERYWLRAVNEEVDPQDVRDQDVLRNTTGWLQAPALDAPLVTRLCEGSFYVEVWEQYSPQFFLGREGDLLLLGEHVQDRLLATHGAEASGQEGHDASAAVRRLAKRLLGRGGREGWLVARLEQAIPRSLLLALEVYSRWADTEVGIGTPDDQRVLRRLLHERASHHFTTGQSILDVVHPHVPYDLFWLVYPPRESEADSFLRGVEHWQWLGPVILDALRLDPGKMAARVAYLISEPAADEHPAHRVHRASQERLSGFFGVEASSVIRLLGQARELTAAEHRGVLDQVVRSAIPLFPITEVGRV